MITDIPIPGWHIENDLGGILDLNRRVAQKDCINPAPVITSAGIVGIVVAIAARDSLSNLFGGLSIALDKPFKDGDYIVLDTGERGKVTWVGFRSTRILTRDFDTTLNFLEWPGYSFSRTALKDSSSSAVREVLRTFPLKLAELIENLIRSGLAHEDK